MTKLLLIFLGALIYILWPFDVIPDFLGLIGWIDDLLVAALAVYTAVETFKRAMRRGPPPGRRRPRAGGRPPEDVIDTTAEPGAEGIPDDPHELLGVSPGAGPEEIRDAYRREMAKYHPDKVQHLGDELKKLAALRTQAIRRAYDNLVQG